MIKFYDQSKKSKKVRVGSYFRQETKINQQIIMKNNRQK